MSTKTTFKRVALVAVAALGLGVLSVAPSQAAPSLTVTTTDGTAGLPGVRTDSTTAATINIAGLLEVGDSATVSIVLKSHPTTTSGGATAAALVKLQNVDSATPTMSGYVVDTITATAAASAVTGGTFPVGEGLTAEQSTVARISKSSGPANINHTFDVQFDSAAATTRIAGTYVYTVYVKSYSGNSGSAPSVLTATFAKDVSIVIAAAATDSKVANAATSTAVLSAGATDGGSTQDSSVAALATASATARAVIKVTLKNAAGGNAQESLTAVVTGPGTVGVSGGSFGKNVTVATSAGVTTFEVRADGTAGTASIVISSPSVTFAAKSVTFYAASAKTITASANKPVIGASANTEVIYAKAVDANGTAWGGTAYIWAASAADALIAGSETAAACTYVASDSVHACSVTGKLAGTANFIVADSDSKTATTTVKSAPVAVKVSVGTPATVKLAFDKATYAPGEKAKVWVTALDSAGNAVPEQTITDLFATGGITSSTAFSAGSDTLTATFAAIAGATSASAGTVAGYKVYTVYMPMSSGAVTISATGGTGLATAGRVAVSATAEVVNSSVDAATDAANEATDAANAATDAALAAADAADAATAAAQDASDAVAALSASVSKLISSLRAQITSLTNLVIKIQKKVRA